MTDETSNLRSRVWFDRTDTAGFFHRTHLKSQGHLKEMFEGRPVIGIANSASQLVPCNSHLTELAEWVSRGVLEAGGFPLVFPTMSIGDSLMRPSGMMFRNLMSMELEELIRANPIDGVVLLTGCDNTAPAYAMGAASVDVPAIIVHAGPMMSGNFRGRTVGSGTDIYKLYDSSRSGRLPSDAFAESEFGMSRSVGTCNTMGTASTMGLVLEAMGLSLLGTAGIPAVDARKKSSAQRAGRRIVDLVRSGTKISAIATRKAFENAIRVNAAIGGGTNTTVHLLALAGRFGVELTIDDIETNSRPIKLMANIMPNGDFLMEDFFNAGGLPALMKSMGELLHLDAMTVSGQTIGDMVGDAEIFDPRVIATPDSPFKKEPALAVLKGNLAPNGAIIKATAASPHLLKHRGKAVVFESIEDMDARIDSPDLEVDASSVLVLKNIGPTSYPGAPELGNIKVPKKLLDQNVFDVLRLSDGRMSGTAFGTVILQVTPETAIGGPIALVENGDLIEFDLSERRLTLHVSEEELARRRANWRPSTIVAERGFRRLFIEHVLQADQGLDFDFLRGASGSDPSQRRPY
ncbi:dihydroxy-acid dehydratase [Mesorhizobium sp. VK23B]|uniref:Dihydroxy-acid dehydratase n=1 Tax=Mesorhizobium dulcispinae TaxID=3072316 RepID=A0ABU4XFG4_9HYPH|nr:MULTISPECIES: dihydroxy-acid dehydratase [unclassified Mesorhizobium]MDX8466899.1 dihydroxy-acid dehydratase [Mesorhizobium sp. VK23B]MDX8473522.1 dihydroxy-acid dehydratase [Mesorhizobium sp. VK23A]